MSINSEISKLKKQFANFPRLKIAHFETEQTLYLTYTHNSTRYRFNVFLFDYPSCLPKLSTENKELQNIVTKTNDQNGKKLAQLIETMIGKLSSKFDLGLDFKKMSIAKEEDNSYDSSYTSGSESSPFEESETTEDSYQDPESDEIDFLSEDEEFDMDFGLGGGISKNGTKLLKDDLEQAEMLFEDSVQYFEKLNTLKMELDVSFLGPNYADALGIDERRPINLVFDFAIGYIDGDELPSIELFQGDSTKKETFGLEFQLREILLKFLRKTNNYYQNLAKLRLKKPKKNALKKKLSLSILKEKEMNQENTGGGWFFNRKKNNKKELQKEKEKEKEIEPENKEWTNQNLKQLQKMGFNKYESIGALIMCQNDVFKATNLLVEEDRLTLDRKGREAVHGTQKKQFPVLDGDSKIALDGVRQSYIRGSISNSKEVNLDSFIPGDNFIIDIYDYATARVRNCTNYCMICGSWLKTQGLKPTCCDEPACIFRHQEMGLGVNVSAEIVKTPDLVDFLISTAYSAASSNRRENIFNPFPPEYFKQGGKVKDFDRIQKALDSLPSVDEMAKYERNEKKLRKELESKNKDSYRLLRWLLTTNRSHLIKIPKQFQLNAFGTEHQWILLSAHPKKEAKFLELKKKHKTSVFAFHGSSGENWFSILRVGLKNYSNTKNMVCGAAYGPGIYLAPQPSTSMGYAKTGQGWGKSRIGSGNFNCMAICEIIKDKTVVAKPYYVIPNEDLVMTKIFIVNFTSNRSTKFDPNILHQKIPQILSGIKKERW
ncbi:poly adp-ribose polymerase family member parp [Anaeramoeba flamelloides]|uniref:Poly [ADP-ribose] polymerase n=1 Tax=Anaeramoeba flamelloides TaxID=1746091 RepID=A0AAV7ZCA4_9EUKA|nr:poly adp-ribose polymerase family member parp [Anaeramoeba flamelloides]